jgi:hypothetical protein
VIDVRHALLSSGSNFGSEKDDGMSGMATSRHGKLSEEEVMKYQATLARSIVIFMELLHLLIARNRDILLAVVQEHKRRSRYSQNSNNMMNKMSSNASYFSNPASPDNGPRMSRATSRSARPGSSSSIAGQSIGIMSDAFSTVEQQDAGGGVGDAGSVVSAMGSVSKGVGAADAAIAIQRELQRAFISLAKLMQPLISSAIYSETPKWLKHCTQDQYLYSGAYRTTKLCKYSKYEGWKLFFGDIVCKHHGARL